MTRPTVKIPSPAGKEPAGKENGTASMDAGTGTGSSNFKDVPAAGKAEDHALRNAPQPRRRTTLDRNNTMPELNAYIKSRVPKGEPTSYLELVRYLGELRVTGEKGHKQLLATVLPRLAQFGVLPAQLLVPQLLQLMSTTDDRRLARILYYLLQTLLGAGSAGTPSPTPSPTQSGALEVSKDVAAKAWQNVLLPHADSRLVDLEMRVLAAASRGADGRHDKQLAQAVRALLERAAGSPSQLPSAKRTGRRSSQAETWDVQWSALSAARASLRGKALRDASTRGMDGIVSQEPTVARHAMALLVGLARHGGAQLLEQHKELASLVNGAAAAYESSGLVVGSDSKKSSPSKLQALGASINIMDKWARVYLARLCAALLYADWASAIEFAKGPGQPFWRMLTLLATMDKEEFVMMEAIKSMFGCLPSAVGPLFSAAPASEDLKDAKMRARAWALVSSEAKRPAVSIPGLQSEASATLMGSMGAALSSAMQSGSAPSVCAACRAAGAMTEARAGVGPGTAEAERVWSSVTDALSEVLRSYGASSTERCAALEALIWAQTPDILPSSIVHHISATAEDGDLAERWTADLIQSVFQTLQKVLRALPPAARVVLASAAALAAAAPSAVKADMLFAMWSAALKQGEAARMAAISAALQIISSPQWPACARPPTGAPTSAISKAAEDDAAWTELQKGAAWWLGEFVNVATGEVTGKAAKEEDNGVLDDDDLACISPAEILALKALRNAPIAATVSHLQHAAATLPWNVRVAAVQALAKVAVRSEEPYRLQCYTFLTAVSSSDYLGLASHVQPVLPILDALYSTWAVLEKLAVQHGEQPGKWPPVIVKQLRQRHNQLTSRIERHICSLANAEYYPIGPRSRELLTSGVEGLAPGERLPSYAVKAPDGLSALMTRDSARSQHDDRVPAELDSDEESPIETPREPESVPMTPILNGSDPLTDLTRDLDDRLRADAYRQRGPSPWQTTFDAEPSFDDEDVTSTRYSFEAEQPAFGFTERDVDAPTSYHSRKSSADKVHYVNGRGIVQHTFDAEVPEELSVYPGEEVEVVAEVDGWLHCVASNGSKGLVPASYVVLLRADQHVPPFRANSPTYQMEQQPSFDPLAEPDMLAAMTQAPPPINSWMSFDEPESSPFREPSDASTAFNRSSRSLDASQVGEERWSEAHFETDFGSGPADGAAEASTSAPAREQPLVPSLSLQEIDAAIDREMGDLKALGSTAGERGQGEVTAVPATAETGAGVRPDDSRSPRPSGDGNGLRSGPVGTPRRRSFSHPPPTKTASARSVASSSGAPVTPGRHSRQGSMADTAGSPRVTPRHSRTSSVEALANAASFVQPYKATIVYGFDAEAEDELSVVPGEEVTVHVEIEGWVQVTRARDGQKGLVPASYLNTA
ncbi:g10940 [Coccomyxa elongata]